MPTLPKSFQSVHNFGRLKPVLFYLFLVSCFLFTLSFVEGFLVSPSAYAAAGDPPQPLPCQNPIEDESILTDNWLVNEKKEPPPGLNRIKITVTRPRGTYDISEPVDFTVDFSKLGALFGPENSDYLEGKYQDTSHQRADTTNLNREDLNSFHGPAEKAAPRAMLDKLKVNYVKYVYEHPNLSESANEFADTSGKDPKVIWQLVKDHNLPDPSQDRNNSDWQNGWGKYWDKIPTAYSEFYEGQIVFREESKPVQIQSVLNGGHCPDPLPRVIKFVMPEFFRTTATSGQLNKIIVPSAAQSKNSNNLVLEPKNSSTVQNKNLLGKIIDTCLKAVSKNPFTDALQKVIKVGQKLNPIKIVYAEDNPPYLNQDDLNGNSNCIRASKQGKEGNDPYCALPAGQLHPGETCENKIDDLKVDKNNPDVVCHFKIDWAPKYKMQIPDVGEAPWQWDECNQVGGGLYTCSVEVSIWPIFRIPWTTEIWNNTVYSDSTKHEPFVGSKDSQEEGRPGVYSFFTPRTVFEDDLEKAKRECAAVGQIGPSDSLPQSCQDMIDIVSKAAEESNNETLKQEFKNCVQGALFDINRLTSCVKGVAEHIEKKLPGENSQKSENDLKRRVIGISGCSQELTHNILLDRGIQKDIGVTAPCNLKLANASGPSTYGPAPVIPNCPGVTPASNGNNSDGFETSRDELVCYIISKTGGKIEPKSGQPLADVMIRVMDAESGGNQCAIAAAGEVGVFQYIAETWKGINNAQNIDSGSVHASASGACWGNPGVEPQATTQPPSDDPHAFDWVFHFGANKDGEAWNPFLQIDKTIAKMENGDAEIWCTYRKIYEPPEKWCQ